MIMECYLDVMLQVHMQLGRKGRVMMLKSNWLWGINIDSALWNHPADNLNFIAIFFRCDGFF